MRFLFPGLAAILACSSPTPTNRDVLEMERVWQYLKAFSLWQDRVPSDPLAFATPEELAASINDTLYDSSRYTYYLAPGSFDANQIFGTIVPISTQNALRNVSATVRFDSAWSATAAYLQIALFDTTTLSGLLAISSGKPDLVVDLRNNHGGNIDVCTSAVELFLPAFRPYIRATYRKNVWDQGDTGWVHDRILMTRRNNDRWEGKRIAVLIDEGSASAAEIFAAALRDGLDSAKVLLIGRRTFGKGIGQYVRLLDSGAAMSITGFRFRRVADDPIVNDYHLRGIEPDIPTDAPEPAARMYFRGMLAKTGQAVATFAPHTRSTPLCYTLLAGPESLLSAAFSNASLPSLDANHAMLSAPMLSR